MCLRRRTYQVFCEKSLWIAFVPLQLFARSDARTHLAATREHSMQRLEPEGVGIPCFIVILTERLKSVDDGLKVRAVVPVDQENQDVQKKPSCW